MGADVPGAAVTDRKCPDCGRRKGLRVMTAKMFKRWFMRGLPTRERGTPPMPRKVTFMRCPCTSVFKVYGAAAGGTK